MAHKIIVLFLFIMLFLSSNIWADSYWGTMYWGEDIWYPVDTDSDGISDIDEEDTYGTNPDNPDTDGDGLNDGDEVNYWGVAWNDDTDGDLLINILDQDSDGDGLSDGVEVNILNTDPALTDSDDNGIPDNSEDNDGDGFTNAEEVQCGSDPTDPDSKCSRAMPWLPLLLE